MIAALARRPKFFVSLLLTVAVAVAIGAATALAVCVPTVYTVTSSAPPPLGNWTDTSGAVWTPSGGFPGCAPGDTASDTNPTSTTLIVNTTIPNPIIGLNLNCAGCTIDIQSSGHLTLAGTGTVSAAATIIVEPGGTLTLQNGANLTFQSGSSLSVNGGYTDVQSGAVLVLNGNSTVTNGGTLNVNGTMTVNATFTVQSTGQITLGGATVDGSNAINNNGIVSQNGADSTISAVLNNKAGATVDVAAGTLRLAGGGSGDAPFTIQSGADLDFPAGTYTMTPNGTVSGSGTLSVSGGTLSIGGVTAPSNFSISAGILTGAGFLSIAGPFDWHGGTITGSGGTEIGGTGFGSFDGSSGPMVLDGRSFNMYGFTNFSSAANPLQLANGAAFNVYGTFEFITDGSVATDGSSTAFNVAPNGILQKTGGTGVSAIHPPSSNAASVNAYSGTLEFSGGGSHSGCFYAGPAGTLAFDTNSNTFTGCMTGDGTYSFPDSSASISAYYDVGTTSIAGAYVHVDDGRTRDLLLDGGTLDVGSFDLTGTGTWSGGTISGSNVYVDGAAALTIDAANGNATLDTVAFQNDGTTTYTATPLSGRYLELRNGATIVNNGTFDIKDDQPIRISVVIIGTGRRPRPSSASAVSTIANHGTWKKSAGSGTTDIDPAFTTDGTVLAQSGTMHFLGGYTQTAGTTTLGPGGISSDTTVQLQGGVLDGVGTMTGDVQNDGATVAPNGSGNTGTINVTGNYTQGSGGALNIELASPTAFDKLAAGGTATLDGTLNVALLSGYAPANGQTWPVLTFAARSGDFAVKNLPTYPPTGSIAASYTPTELDLSAVVGPQANLAITKTGPSGVVAGQNVTYTITVTNNGPSAATSVVVSDPQPANLAFVSASGACSGGFPCSLGTLNASQSVSFTATYSTSPSFSGNVTNTASVSSTTPDPDNSDNTASATTNVGAQADLSIVKTGPPSVTPGQNVTFTLTFSNGGPSPATNTTINDPTPVGLAFLSNSGACTTPFPCSLGTLNAGGSGTITSTYAVPSTYSGAMIANTATITSDVNDPATSNNSSLATVAVAQQSDLSIAKTGPASATPGLPVVYTITVSNLGPSAAANVTVSDPTPSGLSFVSNTGACTTPFPCNVGTLNASQSATITTTFLVAANYASPSIVNTASVSSASSDGNTNNDSSTATTPVTAQADVAIAKSGPATTTPGANVVYTVAVTNNGPLAAANVFVSDPTPTGLTFVGNSGGCSGPYPCALGTLTPGQTVTIASTYAVPQGFTGTTITNAAQVSSSTPDANPANNTAVATTSLSGTLTADLRVTKRGPSNAPAGTVAAFTISVGNAGPNAAQNVVVSDPTPPGTTFVSNSGGCTTPYPCNVGTLAPGQNVTITSRYHVDAGVRGSFANTASASSSATDPNPGDNASTVVVRTQAAAPCPTHAPTQIAPVGNASVASPVTFTWSSVPNAASYTVTINGAGAPAPITTSSTSIAVTLPPGPFTWDVAVNGQSCLPLSSGFAPFTVCGTPAAPVPAVVGEATTGQTFTVSWDPPDFAVSYELQEALDAAFTSPQTFAITATSRAFTKNIGVPTAFFYRVRARSACGDVGPFSSPISVVVIPPPSPNALGPSVNAPAGSTTPVSFQLNVPGLPGGTTTFVATADRPWLSVFPTSGIIGPQGLTFTITADPTALPNGTWTGTVIIVYGTASVSGRFGAQGSTTTSIPVSINLTTPIKPGALPQLGPNALVIPSVGHLAGLSSDWRSDIRIANVAATSQKFQLTFNPGSGDPNAAVKQTTISVDAGATTALDDIVRNWFGIGSLGDSSNGMLFIQPLDNAKVSVATTAVVTSRTYNAQPLTAGTLGQFIPAVPFANFAGSGGATLTLQQIAQSADYRTNLGVIEAAGKPLSTLVSVFDGAGSHLIDFTVALKAGQQQQLNGFLATAGISNLTNGHIEVKPTSGDGKATAYASVIDAHSGDPILISAVPIGGGASRFVVPGIADLDNGAANWRSDVRVFNGGAAPQTAMLTFYPLGGGASSTKPLTVNPGETAALDDILHSLFGITNAGGTLHVTTPANAPLVVTARTYDQTTQGTLGQFIPAVTPADTAGLGDRPLQLVQVEDSVRYRTNFGIVETSGKPVTAEVAVFLPDSKVQPRAQISLAPFESKQFPILSSLGLSNAYNARISVKVIDGDGRITAYGSVIDMTTQAPTYVPAQ
jgi:uncharacterized repeat protein (TIGR01451 family)